MSFKPSQMTAEIGFPVARSHIRLHDPLPLKAPHYVSRPPLIERVREALERCGITNEHAVSAVMEIIEDR